MRRPELLLAACSFPAAAALAVIVHPAAGAAIVLVVIVGYVLSGRTWPTLGVGARALTVAAAVALTFVVLPPTAFYVYFVSIGAGLCGARTIAADVASVAAYGVVASWGLASPRRLLFALPAAVVAAASTFLIVRYPFAAAHGYCET